MTGWAEQIFEAMMPLVEELKRMQGHTGPGHFGWSTMASSYRDGYPEDGTLTLCGCGEILVSDHDDVEVNP